VPRGCRVHRAAGSMNERAREAIAIEKRLVE